MNANTGHPIPLSNATLTSLPAGVPGPAYDRGRVSVGIVHVGVGGFHRAHQAMYLDRLMNQGQALSWGICGVGVMPADQRMKEALNAQDGLYTLMVKNPDGTIEPTVQLQRVNRTALTLRQEPEAARRGQHPAGVPHDHQRGWRGGGLDPARAMAHLRVDHE